MELNRRYDELNEELLKICGQLEIENEKLREENIRLKKTIEKMNIYLQNEIKEDNKMDDYVDGIRNGIFKPRLNKDVNEKVILEAILKLKTTSMERVANELNTSYSTIRRRLIKYNLYPINLQEILDRYTIFYSADNE